MAVCLGKDWTAWCGQVRAAEAQPCAVRRPPPRPNTGFRSRVRGGGGRGSWLLRAPSQPCPLPVPWASEALRSPAVSALHAWPEQSLVAGSTRAAEVQSASAGRKSGRALEVVQDPWRACFPRSDWATWAP